MDSNEQFNKRTQAEGRALLRIEAELRSYLKDAPEDDPDVRSLLADCEALHRVGSWLSTTSAVTFPDGVLTN
jgi:hypothetical protein